MSYYYYLSGEGEYGHDFDYSLLKSKSTKSEIVGESLQETKTPLLLLAITKLLTNGYDTLDVIYIYSVPLTLWR